MGRILSQLCITTLPLYINILWYKTISFFAHLFH